MLKQQSSTWIALDTKSCFLKVSDSRVSFSLCGSTGIQEQNRLKALHRITQTSLALFADTDATVFTVSFEFEILSLSLSVSFSVWNSQAALILISTSCGGPFMYYRDYNSIPWTMRGLEPTSPFTTSRLSSSSSPSTYAIINCKISFSCIRKIKKNTSSDFSSSHASGERVKQRSLSKLIVCTNSRAWLMVHFNPFTSSNYNIITIVHLHAKRQERHSSMVSCKRAWEMISCKAQRATMSGSQEWRKKKSWTVNRHNTSWSNTTSGRDCPDLNPAQIWASTGWSHVSNVA